jgi:putative transcriptional regulator
MSRVGKFLVATPKIRTGFFEHSVIFIYEDSLNGTAGLVINKPSSIDFADIAGDRNIDYPRNTTLIHTGGPVTPRAVTLLHTDEWASQNTLHTSTGLDISSDEVMLHKIATGNTPQGFRTFSGLSIWVPGQLDHEISHQQWLLTELPHSAVFDVDGVKQWERSVELYGQQFVAEWF